MHTCKAAILCSSSGVQLLEMNLLPGEESHMSLSQEI